MTYSKSSLALATAAVLMMSSAAFAQEQGDRAGVPAGPGGKTYDAAPGTSTTGYSSGPVSGRSNSTTAIENQRSSGQGSGPKGGDPNGN